MDEIAAQTLSSRKTVLRYLRQFQIPIRPEDGLRNGQVTFGIKRVHGALVTHHQEQVALVKMQELQKKGYSYREVVDILNSMRIPTKRPGAQWHIKTVHKIMKRDRERKLAEIAVSRRT